jgi:hypothetical protein
MDVKSIGLLVVVAGCLVAVVGLLIYSGLFSWFGRLPGDLRAEGENVRVYVPFTSMILLSAVLSLLFYLVRRFF